jgi:hypothetical protein
MHGLKDYISECLQEAPFAFRRGVVVVTIIANLVLALGLYLGWHLNALTSFQITTAAVIIAGLEIILILPYRLWKSNKAEINLLKATADQKKEKRRLLDEIGELRAEMINLRIEMDNDIGPKMVSDSEWSKRLEELKNRIADKIDQFSSNAEANAYRYIGNVPRPINTNMGGFLHPMHLDICIHDIDYLKQFIIDYSRNKDRST